MMMRFIQSQKSKKKRKSEQRALRAIIEDFMLDIMYEIPKDDNIGAVRITKRLCRKEGWTGNYDEGNT